MTESYSKPRQLAETAFGKTQSQFFARERAFEELDTIVMAREEKTSRLREARLAREMQDNVSRTAIMDAKSSRKR